MPSIEIERRLGKIPGVHHTQSYLLPLRIKDFATWLPTYSLDDRNGNDSKDPPLIQSN
jgi:hypothetical protein